MTNTPHSFEQIAAFEADRTKWNARVKELSRMKKNDLVRIADAQMKADGRTRIYGAPHFKWTKDELTNEILRNEFPAIYSNGR